MRRWKVVWFGDGGEGEVEYNSRQLRTLPQLFLDGTVYRVTITPVEDVVSTTLSSVLGRFLDDDET